MRDAEGVFFSMPFRLYADPELSTWTRKITKEKSYRKSYETKPSEFPKPQYQNFHFCKKTKKHLINHSKNYRSFISFRFVSVCLTTTV